MEYIEIDGSQGEGGGQILRTAVALSSILEKPLKIKNIRARRSQPGLRPQHLQAILAASQLCKGILKGASVGSTEIEYHPGNPESGRIIVDTQTAGSVSLIAQTIIPIAIFRSLELECEIRGGTEVPNSPTVDYLINVALPMYSKFGARVGMDVTKRGYYPKGGGIVELKNHASRSRLMPLDQVHTKEKIGAVKILSVSRNLPSHVSQRQMAACKKTLEQEISRFRGFETRFDTDGQSLSPGSSISLWYASGTRLVGSLSLGERGKRAELVGEEAANFFISEMENNPEFDSHLADMIVPIAVCLSGTTRFTTSKITSHLRTNLEIAKQITSATYEINESVDGKPASVSIFPTGDKSI